jgi:hypothetical protein
VALPPDIKHPSTGCMIACCLVAALTACQHERSPTVVLHRAEAPCRGSAPEDQRLHETTVAQLSGYSVGLSNIFERDLPDESGFVASRMSAQLSIWDDTKASREETVIAGAIVTIGADRYCVKSIEPGDTAPGWVSLRQVR